VEHSPKRGDRPLFKKTLLGVSFLIFLSFSLATQGLAQKDHIAQIAIDTVRAHMGLRPGVEIKFIEKKQQGTLIIGIRAPTR